MDPNVQTRLDEPVLAAGTFSAALGTGRTLSETIVVAVTPCRIHAFAADPLGEDVRLGAELATWERAQANVSVNHGSAHTTVVIRAAGEETLACSTGRDGPSSEVLRYLENPRMVAA